MGAGGLFVKCLQEAKVKEWREREEEEAPTKVCMEEQWFYPTRNSLKYWLEYDSEFSYWVSGKVGYLSTDSHISLVKGCPWRLNLQHFGAIP